VSLELLLRAGTYPKLSDKLMCGRTMRKLVHQLLVVVIVLAMVGILPHSSRCAEDFSSDETGIRERTPWTTSQIVGSPDPTSSYRVEKVFPNLEFKRPTVLTTAPGSTHWYLAELTGKIYSFPHDPDIEQDDVRLFVDLTAHIEKVSHVYGVTFHPDFKRNRYVYICYLQGGGYSGSNHVSRFEVTADDPPRFDPASEQLLLKWPTDGHNGGCLKFGPDGYLYISSGDGAAPSPPDPRNTGQDISDFKSSILRIDVNRTENGLPYANPTDNPFVNQEGARPEIWAYGFRNPWKMSFDPVSGDLWVGDVGWDMWEMVFRVERGGNYGWSIVEGGQSIRTDLKPGPTPIRPPVLVHPHSEFRSITGGYVYHGKVFPELDGAYVYGDFVTGKLWGLRYDGERVTWKQELVDTRLPIITFAEDHGGELYIVDYGKSDDQAEGGTIYRLESDEAGEANADFPRTLSETGLFSLIRGHKMAAGVIPYSINAEPWADGAVAARAVGIPNREQLSVYKENQILLGERKGAWSFPNNSVLVKTLSLDLVPSGAAGASGLQPIETQILHKDGDVWRAYAYAWNEEGTDASLVPIQGAERVFRVVDPHAPGGSRQQTWRFYGRNECIVCHSLRAGFVLGFHPDQLSRDHNDGGTATSQLSRLSHIGLFADPVPPVKNSLVSPGDPEFALDRRARSYLDVNCAHCHGNGGGGTAQFRLQHDLSLEQTGLLSSTLTQGDFGIDQPRIVAAGDPYRSVLYYRMAKLGRAHMPHIGSYVLDEQGLRWIHDWISELPRSPSVERSADRELATILSAQREDLQELSSGKNTVQEALGELLQTTSGGMTVQHGILRGAFHSATEHQILATAAGLSNPNVRELFEHFLPEEERPREIGINPTHVLGLQGDSSRGERLFFADTRLQCKKCHQVEDQGESLGPNLNRIGHKYQPNELLASMLSPSEKIDFQYLPWLLFTKDGTVHSGLLVERTAEQVILKDSQGKDIRVPAADVDEMIAQQNSLMPEDVLRDMSPEEVADLLAYLSSLK